MTQTQNEPLDVLATYQPALDWTSEYPADRLGTVVYSDILFGQVLHQVWPEGGQAINVNGRNVNYYQGYFAWPTGSGRGYLKDTFDEAMVAIGRQKPVGCADWDGMVRLGKVVERGPEGEIWKHTANQYAPNDYYFWPKDSSLAHQYFSYTAARERAGIVLKPDVSKLTPAKSSYAQNRPGYKAATK